MRVKAPNKFPRRFELDFSPTDQLVYRTWKLNGKTRIAKIARRFVSVCCCSNVDDDEDSQRCSLETDVGSDKLSE